MLKRYAVDRDRNEWAPLVELGPFQGTTAFVDASKNKCLAGIVFLGGCVNPQPPMGHTVDLEDGTDSHINVLEARAVYEAIRLTQLSLPRANEFRFATDSSVVFHAVERRSSKSPAIRECLRQIFAALGRGTGPGRIEMRLVPGILNPADIASREWVNLLTPGSPSFLAILRDFRDRMRQALPLIAGWVEGLIGDSMDGSTD